ncbi:MAG: HAD family hydrolase [Acidobacteria bacterium]|nr:HAD family hydrolase [Acidobacteriota bacterium]
MGNHRGRRFVILDRDGTLNVERNYLSDPAGMELLPGVLEGLRHLRALGLGLLVVTNQSGVGRGFFDLSRLDAIHARLEELLAAGGVRLDGIYWCPHKPEDDCRCRKPKNGLLVQAAEELNFDPRRCFVVGDKPCDIEMGQNLGAVTILVTTGYGSQTWENQATQPDFVAAGLVQAAQLIEHLLKQQND